MRALWILVAVAAIASVQFGCSRSDTEAETAREETTETPTHLVNINVTGMTCTGCEAAVKHALKSVEGVHDARVSYKNGSAEVVIDSTKVDVEALIDAVNRTGYTASCRSS